MVVALFGFWLLLNGQWTAEIAVTGAVVCVLIWLFLWRFLGYSPKREWAFFRRLPKAAAYVVYLVRAVIRAALAVIRLVWSPVLVPQPKLTAFRSKLKTETGKVVLADSITLTPGTITVAMRGDRYLVHCLDEEMAEGLEDSDMEHRVAELEGGTDHA